MNSLQNPKIASQLDYLHEQALGDEQRWAARREELSRQPSTGNSNEPDPLIRMGEFYIPVSREEGEFLYLLARAKNAQHLVEFGASFGISTLYLAAAARDCGGKVTTTEIHPEKCKALRASFATAEVEAEVRLLEGDAQQTLKEIDTPIDILFLDGWKSLYLPVFELLRPLLSPGALIAADNITFKETQAYLDRVQAPDSGLITQIIGDLALSCVTG